MSGSYFWNGAKVLSYPTVATITLAQDQNLTDLPCFDSTEKNEQFRSGMFVSKPLIDGTYWKHLKLDELPPEFRMHLLLLGVS